jgi:hypothetical protein
LHDQIKRFIRIGKLRRISLHQVEKGVPFFGGLNSRFHEVNAHCCRDTELREAMKDVAGSTTHIQYRSMLQFNSLLP